MEQDLSQKTGDVISTIHKDMLRRTSAFLMIKDSKASFTIEGELSSQTRISRWGKAIEQAGKRPLNKEELFSLQHIVIENSRFIKMGYRTEGGFVGEHDRHTGEPIPDHISARWENLEEQLSGLFATASFMEISMYDPVLSEASVAFGFVFIHPFVDGNGRLHWYLLHHILSAMKFTPQGIIFPVSSAILEKIDEYRKVLETYSHPLLEFIKWEATPENNVEVLNETIDYYRYFDATLQAEYLFECIDYTIKKIIPDEVDYLKKNDTMKAWLDDHFEMPDKMVALLLRFLDQNNGKISKRAIDKEFQGVTEQEVKEIELMYLSIMSN